MGSTPLITSLQGYLERHESGWFWCDGTPEPRVRDLRVDDFNPDWPTEEREGRLYIRIPEDFRSAIAPGNTALIGAIQQLIRDTCASTTTMPEPEYSASERVTPIRSGGWLVALDAWRRTLAGPHGASWAAHDEPAIFSIAQSLGYKLPYTPGPD